MKFHQPQLSRRGLLSAAALGVPALGLAGALNLAAVPKAHAAPSVQAFVEKALSCVGCAYVWGAEGPWEFDCSGLITWALRQVGVEMPHQSGQQIARCNYQPLGDALATYGALLWKPGHIGISLGDGRALEARDETSGVNIFPASDTLWSYGGMVPELDYNGGGGGGGGGGALPVDGYWGSATTSKLQELLGTTVDGVVSSQSSHWQSQNPGLASGWEWVADSAATGSPVIQALQSKVGVTADGLIGPGTISAIQSYYGTPVDGVFSEGSACIMAMQTALNAGRV